MGEFLNDAAHWRRRAEQTRAKADTSFNDRGRLLKVAEEYDRLAERAEQWHPAAPPWKTRHRDRRTPLWRLTARCATSQWRSTVAF